MKHRLSFPPGVWCVLGLAWSALAAPAQTETLIREVASREVSMHVGGVQAPEIRSIASREASLYVENGPAEPYAQWVSREVSLARATPQPPLAVTGFVVTPSASGDRVELDWRSYNQWAERDVARFDIYLADAAFTNVTGRTPFLSVPAESLGAVLTGLPTFRDHFLAVVAVDAVGNYGTAVTYSAAYILTKSLASREVSLSVQNGPAEPYHQWVSREISLVRVTPEPPPGITNFTRWGSPSGHTVSVGWGTYNPWAERDVAGYDVYLAGRPFTSVAGMTPVARVGGETLEVTLRGLPELRDHFLAVVPVDGLGNYAPAVRYVGVYILSPEAVSREAGLFVGEEPAPPYRQAVSRELSVLRPDAEVPEPVTGVDSGFRVATSRAQPRALEVNWDSYNETKQRDVVRYRLYLGREFFADVTGLAPAALVADGGQQFLLKGLQSATIYYVAVVAEDALGQFDPVVRAMSAITTPPLEMTVPDLAGDELVPLRHQLTVTEADLREYALAFGLVNGPPGLAVAADGALLWTPAEEQGPGVHPVTVQVTDNGEPAVTATAQFEIAVREVNLPPMLVAVPDQRIGPLDTLRLQLAATDADLPANALSYALVEGPPGLTVSPAGLLEWAPPAVARPSVHRVLVRVTDDGAPSLADETTVTLLVASVPPVIEIRLLPAAGGLPARVEMRLPTDAGWTYRLEAAEALPTDAWITVASFSGTGGLGVLTDEVAGAPSRYYRVVVE